MSKHGHSTRETLSPTYRSWQHMRTRCLNPKDKNFPRYGGRGITVCAQWGDFKNFLADMGERPKGCSLDRKDANGNYEPGNCRWATEIQQQNNRTNSYLITLHGVSLSLTQWARKTGIARETIRGRIVSGWPVIRALTKPVHPN